MPYVGRALKDRGRWQPDAARSSDCERGHLCARRSAWFVTSITQLAALSRPILRQSRENDHGQDAFRCSLRDAVRRPRAHGEILRERLWLADADAWRGYGQLCPGEDDRNGRRRPPEAAGRDKRRLLPEEARLAGAIPVRRHRR